MNEEKLDKNSTYRAMQERITNALVSLNAYRVANPSNKAIETLMDELEMIHRRIDDGSCITLEEREGLYFNRIASFPVENDDALATELQSIRNFAALSL